MRQHPRKQLTLHISLKALRVAVTTACMYCTEKDFDKDPVSGFTVHQDPARCVEGFTVHQDPARCVEGFRMYQDPARCVEGFTMYQDPARYVRGFTVFQDRAKYVQHFTSNSNLYSKMIRIIIWYRTFENL